MTRSRKGTMTVTEAGKLGGRAGGKKGGLATKEKYGHKFYVNIGRKGGQKVRRLIAAGKKALSQDSSKDQPVLRKSRKRQQMSWRNKPQAI